MTPFYAPNQQCEVMLHVNNMFEITTLNHHYPVNSHNAWVPCIGFTTHSRWEVLRRFMTGVKALENGD